MPRSIKGLLKPTEKQLETSILDYLNTLPGVFAFKVQTTGIFDPKRKVFRTIKNKHLHKGTSDILGLKDGKFFAIEVKRPGKKRPIASPEQSNFLIKVLLYSGKSMCVNDFDQVVQFIKAV